MIETDTSKISDYTCFTIKLPSYLPEGYTFYRAEYYKDENGKVQNSKYVDLYFMNKTTGKGFFMQEDLQMKKQLIRLIQMELLKKYKLMGIR